MGWEAFADLWRNAGMDYRLGLCGIFVGLAVMPAVGVLLMVGDLALAGALWIGGVLLIVLGNWGRVRAIQRYRRDWYPGSPGRGDTLAVSNPSSVGTGDNYLS
jgi:hypothetical protein